MKLLKIECAALTAFIICIFISTYNLDRNCDDIRKNILRLHVIAASDSENDQKLKLELRDELLCAGSEIFSGSKTKKEAEEKISKELAVLESISCRFLEGKGQYDGVTVSLEKCFFPTKKYNGFTLPAGYYDALRVVIGKGEGKNWWCVMFPALCLPASDKTYASFDGILTEESKKIITEEKYELRLWLVEKWQEIKKIYNN